VSGTSRRAALALLLAGLLAACGDEGEPPLFPEDYAATYQEVRDCRFSLEHDLTRMRVLAAPDAMAVYQARNAPFPTGAVVLKPQYDSTDMTCSEILYFTVMQKLEPGSSPDTLDWAWQKVSPDGKVMETDIERCIRCHTGCGKPPEGHDGTCATP
jgi:hypothetical protein